ncbi:alpha/beta fold hydrolase [Streptomyces cyaneofuscatus]|uniref:alpha/beta fold hydrolase n=1 Tax=Streptomyces cyaneofuscatus TaxID=66883 RepID=UPI0037D0F90C
MGGRAAAVLVHGLYHRPEHFGPVADGLRAQGFEVVVPELHRGSLAADTAAVQAAVDALDRPPLLLGHSYGGSVITGVRGARHLVGCGRGIPEHHSWKLIPSTYVVCAGDRAIDPALQRTMAARCTAVREWPTGHSPFVSRPALVVELVAELLGTVSSRT